MLSPTTSPTRTASRSELAGGDPAVLEQAELYNKFKLDEPWDSPHNKELIKEMPRLFLCPSRAKPEPFTTTYRGFVGAGACFETGQDIGIADDHRRDLEHDRGRRGEGRRPLDQARRPAVRPAGQALALRRRLDSPRRLQCGFADGSVRFIKNSISTLVFKALITRAGGEVIAADAF